MTPILIYCRIELNAGIEMTDQLVGILEDTKDPAMTSTVLAAEIDESVSDTEELLADLVDEGRIESVEFDGTTAYYIPPENVSSHKKPDHHCSRCGREVNDTQDSAHMELRKHFTGQRTSAEAVSKEVLCRFCYHDVISWLHGDEELMHVYPHLEEWDIPDHQLEAAKQNPDIQTTYPAED